MSLEIYEKLVDYINEGAIRRGIEETHKLNARYNSFKND